ncbi:MAG: ATPase [Christensenellales bacterium]|jgi:vacuolar-type H+-ATPase subunit H
MSVMSLIELLRTEIEEAPRRLGGKVSLEQEKLLNIVQQAAAELPSDIKNAEYIVKERQRIILEAEHEAEKILEEARVQARTMVSEHEILKEATSNAQKILANAEDNAKAIRRAANDYADELLAEMEEYVGSHLELIRQNRRSLQRPSK